MAAARSSTPEMLEVLLEFGAEINAVHGGGTAITSAVICRRSHIVDFLLENGANPYLQVPEDSPEHKIAGQNAFELATLVGEKEIQNLLSDRFGSFELPASE